MEVKCHHRMYFPGKKKHLKRRHIDQFMNYYYKVCTIFKMMPKMRKKVGPYCPFFEPADIS